MSFQITRQKLHRAQWKNVIRLAKFLNIHGCSCGATKCKLQIIEKIIREINKI